MKSAVPEQGPERNPDTRTIDVIARMYSVAEEIRQLADELHTRLAVLNPPPPEELK